MRSPAAVFLVIALMGAPGWASADNAQKTQTAVEAPSDVAAPPKHARKTRSGLAYVALTKGKGKRHPRPNDRVRVHYSGWTTNGKMFDSSVARGEPAEFAVNGVIKGWTEGLQRMVVGDKMRFWIPAGLAYGETPRRPGLPAGMLVFEVELLDIIAARQP